MWSLGDRNLHVKVNLYAGEPKIHIRKYFQNNNGVWVPTRKGITLTVDEWVRMKEVFDNVDSDILRIQTNPPVPNYMPTPTTFQ